MVLSQTISCVSKFGEEKAVEMMAQAGFDAIDYCFIPLGKKGNIVDTGDYIKYYQNLLETAKRNNVFFNQAHAVTGVDADDKETKINLLIQKNIKCIEISKFMGICTLVVHPVAIGGYIGREEIVFEDNMKYFKTLLPYAEKYGVKLACENMWCSDIKRGVTRGSTCSNPFEHVRYVDEMDSDMFVACLDVGHSSLAGREAQDCIRVLGDRLQALHIHDNDYKDDMHTLPGLSEMNWDEITKALADIDYKGDFTLETDHFFDSLDTVKEVQTGLELSALIGRKLISKIENFK